MTVLISCRALYFCDLNFSRFEAFDHGAIVTSLSPVKDLSVAMGLAPFEGIPRAVALQGPFVDPLYLEMLIEHIQLMRKRIEHGSKNFWVSYRVQFHEGPLPPRTL
jgi:hypothetical protein